MLVRLSQADKQRITNLGGHYGSSKAPDFRLMLEVGTDVLPSLSELASPRELPFATRSEETLVDYSLHVGQCPSIRISNLSSIRQFGEK